MVTRAFPVVYATNVGRTARFWERLGFTRFYQLPADGEPGYVALRRGDAELAVVVGEWACDRYGLTVGDGPRFEMFVYADDIDGLLADLRAEGTTVLRDPADMPWGERIASIADPDGNPVTLANELPGSGLSPPPAGWRTRGAGPRGCQLLAANPHGHH
jgi:lactoylglutathione lyase